MADLETQIQKLSAAIAGLESQRKSLGDAVVDPAIAALREQLTQLESGRGDKAETDERKLVTIVFADVSGFTALSEKLDPEKVRELINACFDWLVPVVQKYDGTIDKFIGDEIMAVFGAPVAHEDDPERALRAALDMMDAIVAFNHANGTTMMSAKGAIKRSGVDPQQIDQVVMGNVLQTSKDAIYLGRHVSIRSGLKPDVPGLILNRSRH